jgi:hypothetical protein
VSVLHETEQRPLLGRGGQEAEHGESDQEPVRDVTRREAQGDVQRIPLRLRERVELVEYRRTELMDPGERELHLRLHARYLRHTESRGLTSGVPEQRRLSDARLPSDDEDAALTLAHLCQEPGEHFALAGPVKEPGRNSGGHLAGNANRCRIHAIITTRYIDSGELRPPMRLLITGGKGVLGCALRPLAEAAGHELAMPGHQELDLFDPFAVADAVRDMDGVLHLATRVRSLDQISNPDVWRENDRLRADASRILVDAAIAAGVEVYVQPTVTFVYPPDGPTSEDTPIGDVLPILRSALAAEQQAQRFARGGGRGVVLRFGLLDGPGTWYDEPMGDFGATLHVSDAGRALLSALSLRSGIYNVCRDGDRVSAERFTRTAGWHPQA